MGQLPLHKAQVVQECQSCKIQETGWTLSLMQSQRVNATRKIKSIGTHGNLQYTPAIYIVNCTTHTG